MSSITSVVVRPHLCRRITGGARSLAALLDHRKGASNLGRDDCGRRAGAEVPHTRVFPWVSCDHRGVLCSDHRALIAIGETDLTNVRFGPAIAAIRRTKHYGKSR